LVFRRKRRKKRKEASRGKRRLALLSDYYLKVLPAE
jgi:hypothetical protein